MEEDLLKIINHYGIAEQLKYIHSEYYELDEAIINCWRGYDYSPIQLGRSYEERIADEIADVMVMLKQFQYFYEITDKTIEDIMKQKISRQLKRIENEIK